MGDASRGSIRFERPPYPRAPRYVLTHLCLRRRTRNIWPGHFVLTLCTLLDYAASNTTTRAWILLVYSDDSAGGRGVLILIARSEPTLGFLVHVCSGVRDRRERQKATRRCVRYGFGQSDTPGGGATRRWAVKSMFGPAAV